MISHRVVITGIGMVTPLGVGRETFWASACAGRSGIRHIQSFDPSSFRTRVGGECRDFDPLTVADKDDLSRIDRVLLLAVAATDEALKDSAISPDEDRTGVMIGTGMGGVATGDQQYENLYNKGARWVNPLTVPMCMHNAAAGYISIRHGLRGPSLTVSTACASGAHAIGEAYRVIKHGYADVMVAGGTEAPLSPGMYTAWNGLRVMATLNEDPAGASRPFSKDRTGFVMAEGAAILVLENREHALARGANIYAELSGFSLNNDGYHTTRPSREGEVKAIRLALKDAGIQPAGVDYISAHGTATSANDAIETETIKEVFGKGAYSIPISSIKSMIGHSIGASGAIESASCCLTLRDGIIPPTINLETPDPDCDLDYVPNEARKAEVKTTLSNSFSFGGCNAILVFSKHQDSLLTAKGQPV